MWFLVCVCVGGAKRRHLVFAMKRPSLGHASLRGGPPPGWGSSPKRNPFPRPSWPCLPRPRPPTGLPTQTPFPGWQVTQFLPLRDRRGSRRCGLLPASDLNPQFSAGVVGKQVPRLPATPTPLPGLWAGHLSAEPCGYLRPVFARSPSPHPVPTTHQCLQAGKRGGLGGGRWGPRLESPTWVSPPAAGAVAGSSGGGLTNEAVRGPSQPTAHLQPCPGAS